MRVETYSYESRYDNTVGTTEGYAFSPAMSFEFYEQQSSDDARSRHAGRYHFRVDYTQVGRYECEFLDHTYGYRGENEVTLLATPASEEWCLTSSHPTGGYRGCVLLIMLNKLCEEDRALLNRFGICIDKLLEEMSADKRWSKFASPQLVTLFQESYAAHARHSGELLLLKSLEILLYIFQQYSGRLVEQTGTHFFPSAQVRKVKAIHRLITEGYTKSISFEALAKEHEINYSVFNTIFKEIYGDSPYQYLKKLKMNLAAQRIIESDRSIMEVAASVGYVNSSKFSGAFQSVMGVLPRTLRNNYRNGVFVGGME